MADMPSGMPVESPAGEAGSVQTLGSIVRKKGFAKVAAAFAGLGALTALPLIGLLASLAAQGYGYEFLRSSVTDDDPPLGGSDHSGDYLATGLKAGFAAFVLVLPILLVLVPAFTAAVNLASGDLVAPSPSVPLTVLAVAAFVALLVWGAFVNVLLLHGVVRGRMGDFFAFREGFGLRYRSAVREFWSGFWGFFAYSFLGGILASVVTFPLGVLTAGATPGSASAVLLSAATSAVSLAVTLPFLLVGFTRYAPYLRKAYGLGSPSEAEVSPEEPSPLEPGPADGEYFLAE